MERSERGQKHQCPECATKYYDLRKAIVVCPKCGAKPAPPTPRRGRIAAKRAMSATSSRRS